MPNTMRLSRSWQLGLSITSVAFSVVWLFRTANFDPPLTLGKLPSKRTHPTQEKSALSELPWLNATSAPLVPSLWNCRSPKPQEKKIVFVHVLKTAGTTLRAFFADYAKRCHAGWVEVQCSAPITSSVGIGRGVWKSRSKRNPCVMKKYVLRSGESRWHTEVIENQFIEDNADIIGGHLPLGTGDVWTDANGGSIHERPQHVQYVAFFRNALSKYVSGEAFWKPEKRLSDLVAETKAKVEKEVTSGQYHRKYDIYLTTPAQRERDARESPFVLLEDRVLRIMMNLVQNDVVIGITERLSESMELLQRLLDDDGNTTDLFVRYGMHKIIEKGESGSLRINPSKISSSAVLKELRKDEPFMANLLEVCKYEQQISDFALALHLRQHASLLTAAKKN